MDRRKLRHLLTLGLCGLLLSLDGRPEAEASGSEATAPARKPPAGAATAPVGSLPGDFAVDANGAATFTIPLEVPPGTGGLAPELSLTYSSHQENGLLGAGWSLSGLSAITRCAATTAQDGAPGAVRFDAGDRFCLDGQRLMAVEGAYGADGTVYHTERQSWVRIVSRGACGSGPCWFEVRGKNGAVMGLGSTADSRIEAPGRAEVRVWALAAAVDLRGNTIEVRYQENRVRGSYVPKKILYTGNLDTGLPPQRAVRFVYESRSDLPVHYLAGSRIHLHQRLAAIETYVDRDGNGKKVVSAGNLVRSVLLHYDERGARGVPRLVKIEACAADGACLPSTVFDYRTPSAPGFAHLGSDDLGGWSDVNSKYEDSHCTYASYGEYPTSSCYTDHHKEQNPKARRFYPMELDADGLTDLVEIRKSGDDTRARAWINRGDGDFDEGAGTRLGSWKDIGSKHEKRYYPMDLDLDGVSELVEIYESNDLALARAWSYDGSEFRVLETSSLGSWKDVTSEQAKRYYPMDADGDGRPDIVVIGKSGDDAVAEIYRANFYGGFDPTGMPASRLGGWKDLGHDRQKRYLPMDVDGDGRGDLVELRHRDDRTRARVWLGDGSFFAEASDSDVGGWKNVTSKKARRYQPADVNGDGLTDIVEIRKKDDRARARAWLNTGIAFVEGGDSDVGGWHDLTSEKVKRYYALDADADGLTDLLEIRKSGDDTHARLWLSDGHDFHEATDGAIGAWKNIGSKDEKRYYPMDVDGDGMADVLELFHSGDSTRARTWRNGGAVPDLVTRITNGLGGSWEISHRPLTDPGVYARGSSASYPSIDVIPPFYVVSRHAVGDARGSSYVFDHRYQGARIDVSGYGWLGFADTTVVDRAAGVETATRHHQTFPLSGLKAEVEVREAGGGARMETSDFTYSELSSNGVYRVRKERETLAKYTDGRFDYQLARRYAYDGYDNVVRLIDEGDTADPDDGLVACLTYANSEDPWALGYPLSRRLTTDEARCGDPAWIDGTDQLWQRFSYDGQRNRVAEESYLYIPRRPGRSRWVATRYAYDAYGNVVRETGPLGHTWRTVYDKVYRAFPRRIVSPRTPGGDRLRTRLTYDPAFGVPVTTTDPNGRTSRVVLDGFGRTVETWGPNLDGKSVRLSTSHFESAHGGTRTETRVRTAWEDDRTSRWLTLREWSDGLGRQYRTSLRGPGGRERLEEVIFDSQGRVERESYPYFPGETPQYAVHEYDVHSHPTRTVLPDGSEVRYEYSLDERQVTTLTPDPRGSGQVATTTAADSRGRLILQVDADGGVTEFAYDPLGRRIFRRDPKGVETTWSYDSLGRLVGSERRDLGAVVLGYDDAGRLRRRTDAAGQRIRLAYDRLDRVVTKTTFRADGSVEARTDLEYDDPRAADGRGRLTAVRMPEATYAYSYQPDGGLAGHRIDLDGDSYYLYRTWDPLGRLASLAYPDGSILTPVYDGDAYLAELWLAEPDSGGLGASRLVASYQDYDVLGQVGRIGLGNGVEIVAEHYSLRESLGRLRRLIAHSPAAGALFDHQYSWNRAGKLVELADPRRGHRESYGYDEMGRLVAADGPYGELAYAYDASGNLTAKDDRTFTYDPDNPHQLASSETLEVAYDANGNLVRRRLADPSGAPGALWEYRYDVEDRLTEVLGDGDRVARFVYDAAGNRLVKKTADGTRVLYLAGAYEVVRYPDGSSTFTKNVDGPGGRVATVTRKATKSRLRPAGYHEAQVAAAMTGGGTLAGALERGCLRLLQGLRHPALAAASRWALPALTVALLALFHLLLAWRAAPPESLCGRLRRRRARRMPQARATAYWRAHPRLRRAVPVALAALLLGQLPGAGAELAPGGGGAGNPGPGTVYFVQDHLTSTTLVTDESGAVVADPAYRPYGEVDEQLSTGTDTFRPKFTGKERDVSSGLVYFGARYYDPELGRFLTADPAGQFDSPYLYAAADPVNHIDPDGEFVILLTALVVAAVVGAYLGGAYANHSWNPAQWDWTSGKTYAGMAVGAAIGVAIVAGGAAVVGAVTGGSVAVAGVSAGTIAGTSLDIAFITYDTYRFAEDPSLENGLYLALDIVFAGAGAGLAARGARGASAAAHEGEIAGREGEAAVHEGETARSAEGGGCFSFPAGTDVATESGPTPIEEIEVGDRVWAFDEAANDNGLHEVTRLFSRWAPGLVRVQAGGVAVATTPEHPFYTENRGWVEAADLRAGDRLVELDGGRTSVSAVDELPESTRVFNFEVARAHTYFVSHREILVHNPKCSKLKGGAYSHMQVNQGEEIDHIPAKANYLGYTGRAKIGRNGVSKARGPAVRMTRSDHLKTTSWGSSKAAKRLRARHTKWIREGKFWKALREDVVERVVKFHGKYNKGLRKAVRYAHEQAMITTRQRNLILKEIH